IIVLFYFFFFFFQAEDGIRDRTVTGVQTCALPISPHSAPRHAGYEDDDGSIRGGGQPWQVVEVLRMCLLHLGEERRRELLRDLRSEERRVGKECGCRGSGDQ